MKTQSIILLITLIAAAMILSCALPQKVENEAEKVATAKMELEEPSTKYLVELGFRIMEFDPNVDARHEPQLLYDLVDFKAGNAKLSDYFKSKEGDELWAVEVEFTARDLQTNNEISGVSIMHYGTLDMGLAELAEMMPSGVPGEMPYPDEAQYPGEVRYPGEMNPRSTPPLKEVEPEMEDESEPEATLPEGALLYIYTGFNEKEVLNIRTAVEKNFKAMKRMKSISKALKLFK